MRSLGYWFWCGALLWCLALVGCAKPKPPTVTPLAARVASVGPNGVVLSLDLQVNNPNGFPLLVRSVTGALLVDGAVEVGRGSAAPLGNIPANGSSTITSSISMSWNNVGALAPKLLLPSLPYRFRGVASLGGERLNVDVPFEVGGQLSQNQLLAIGLRGLQPLAPR